jgi:Tfp pilus assembly protein PilE
MVEMVTIVSIIGVIAAIAIPSFSSLSTNSKDVLAANRQELLNTALNQMAMAGRYISNSPQLGSATDEQLIVMTLQIRDQNLVGSPFIIPNYSPKSSSDPSTYRLRFTGQRFELLSPQQAGIGLKIEHIERTAAQPAPASPAASPAPPAPPPAPTPASPPSSSANRPSWPSP